jgi:uncharacterized protein YndB with AHSA1/START domain
MMIRKQVVVEAPAERAFRVFAEHMETWWPKEHHIGTSSLKACIIEPHVDGRWYEVGEDGSECEWGKVLTWNPPRRLVLAWQLNAEFKYDPALVTEVEVTFTVLGPKRTQVDFEHRDLERLGPTADRAAKDMDRGWGQILESYAGTASA